MDKKRTHRTAIKINTLLLFIFQFCISSTAFSAFPPDYRATYDVIKYGATVGRSTIVLTQNKNQVHYSQNVELVGIISFFKKDRVAENSWLTRNDNGTFLLNKYQYIHSNSKKNRDTLIEATWKKDENNQLTGTITGNTRGKTISLQTNGTVWDTLSFQLALMNDVSNKKTSYHYNVVSRDKIKQYVFRHDGEETIEVNGREYDTVKLERNNGERSIKIWLAPELHYVPVLIENYKDGDLDSTMKLDSIKFDDNHERSSTTQ